MVKSWNLVIMEKWEAWVMRSYDLGLLHSELNNSLKRIIHADLIKI